MTGPGGFVPLGGPDGPEAGAPFRSFRVVVVCGGNLCRSPLAAALLREGLPPGSALEVTSAGTRAMVGSPPPRRLVRLAARRDLDLGDLVPRQLAREHLERADLVLTATREQRATVVGALPGALRRTFTLRELARLLRAAPGASHRTTADQEVARWSALAPTAAAGRSAGAGHGPDDDVLDPSRRAGRAYRTCLAQVEDAVGAVLDAVAGRDGVAPAPHRAHIPGDHPGDRSLAVSMARSSVEDVPGV